jgi:RNA polymerase sigma-70 factor (ECF subfamily)
MQPTRRQFIHWFESEGAVERITNYARLKGGANDQEDIVQTALVRAFRRMSEMSEMSDEVSAGSTSDHELQQWDIERWFFYVVRSVALDWWRLQHRRKTVSVSDVEDLHPTSHGPADDALDRLPVRQALDELTSRERLVVDLIYYEGLRISEVARRLRVSPTAVSKTHLRALRRLLRRFRDST